jgi:hypothetical protein
VAGSAAALSAATQDEREAGADQPEPQAEQVPAMT